MRPAAEIDMKTVVLLLSLLFIGQALAQGQDNGSESLLTDAMKEEIRERAKAEIMERELIRSQDSYSAYRKEIERQVADIKRQSEKARSEQRRFSQQKQAIEREIAGLKRKEADLKRNLADAEKIARVQEAEAVKAAAELEAMKNQAADFNTALEKKREAVLARMVANRENVGKWRDEIAKFQVMVNKAHFNRLEYGKMMSGAEAMAVEIEEKMKRVQADMKLAQADEALKAPAPNGEAPAVPAAPARAVATGGRPWKLGKLCNVYESADAASKKLSKVAGGTVVNADGNDADHGFIKVTAPNGVTGYMRELCGVFQ
jgi:hypothetical protein